MHAIVLREALVAARKPALVGIAIVFATLLALFPMAWGVRGLPTLDGASLYDQQFRLEWILAMMLLPWTAARVIATERADDLVALTAAIAIRPSRVMLARLIAATLSLAAVVSSAVPMAITAQQISAVPASRLLADQLALMTFAAPAAVITVFWMQLARDRVVGWLGAAATALILMSIARLTLSTMDQAAVALAAISVVSAAVLLDRADNWWRYLSEPPA